MAALNTCEVASLLQRVAHLPGRMISLGVHAADKLPSVTRLQAALQASSMCCFIANTDRAKQPGTHWVLFIASKGHSAVQLEYFDSYGLPMSLYTDLYVNVSKQLLPLISVVNSVSLQDLSSSVCGHYCILVAHIRAMGKSFAYTIRYLRSASAVAIERDKFVVRTLHSVLHGSECNVFRYSECLARNNCQQSCCCAAN
jgi:hypothetical protein